MTSLPASFSCCSTMKYLKLSLTCRGSTASYVSSGRMKLLPSRKENKLQLVVKQIHS